MHVSWTSPIGETYNGWDKSVMAMLRGLLLGLICGY